MSCGISCRTENFPAVLCPAVLARTPCANISRRPWCRPGKCQSSIGDNRQSTIVNRLAGRQFVVLVASSWLPRPQTRSMCSLGKCEKGEGRREKRASSFPIFLLFRREQLTQLWLLASRIEHGANLEPIYLCLLNFAAINSTLSCVPAVCCLVSAPCHWRPFPCLLAD